MTLLNAILAAGAAAFSIPLLIHLLNRTRFQVVEWGAMHLLRSTSKVNSRRMEWKHLLLLLIRCLIPVFLAFAMARPLIPSWRDSGDANAMALAIILDDSQSMFSSDFSGSNAKPVAKSRWETGIDHAIRVLQELPRASTASVVLAGAKPQQLDSHAPAELIEQLRLLKRRTNGAGRLQTEAAYRESLQWLSNVSHPKRHVLLISDFQANDWGKVEESPDRLIATIISEQSVVPSTSWICVGDVDADATKQSNLSVESIQCLPSLFTSGQDVTVLATVHNQSSQSQTPITAILYQGDNEMERQEIAFADDSVTSLRFRWKTSDAGLQVLKVQLMARDGMSADDSLSKVVHIKNQQRVLLIDGDRRNEPMQSETDYLRLALSPFSVTQGKQSDLFVTRVAQIGEVNEAFLSDYSLIVLCNVNEVNDATQQLLRKRLEAGVGIVFFMGDRINYQQYQNWPTIANGGLRVCKWGSRIATKSKVAKPKADLFKLSNSTIESIVNANVDYVASATELDPSASVALELDDHAPWMLEAKIGQGTLRWILSSSDLADSNFPTRTSWLPFVQRLAANSLGLSKVSEELEPGYLWNVPVVSKSAVTDVKAQVETPSGRSIEVIAQSTIVANGTDAKHKTELTVADTRQLGIYRTTLDRTSYAVNVALSSSDSMAEHDLQSLSKDQLNSHAKVFGALVATDVSQWLDQVRSRWSGREIWTWLWTGLLVLFLAEIFLEQHISPRRIGAVLNESQQRQGSKASRGAA